jgi:hypothetical protein
MKPGLYDYMGETTYHADPSSLSAGGAKRLLKSPANFLLPNEQSEVLDIGHAIHTAVLGVGCEIVWVDAASWRGKDAAEAQAKARAEEKAPLLTKDKPLVEGIAASVLAHPTASRLLAQTGRPELSAFWHDPDWDLTRRARFDWLTDGGVNVDLKSTVSVNHSDLQRTILKYGYDLSAAWYEDVAHGLGLDLTATALVFVEKTPPYRVRVVELGPDWFARGRALARRALEIYRDCREADLWPNYDDPDFTTIHPPAWAREESA